MEALKQALELWERYAESVNKALIKLLIVVFVLINVWLALLSSDESSSAQATTEPPDCIHKKDGIQICNSVQR
ncbi:MAG: hypothetical protein Hals2KO_14860 [Halioglobus sp.]